MAKVKRINKTKGKTIEVFDERIDGKKVYFVSRVTKNKIETGQAKNKKHALAWANRIA